MHRTRLVRRMTNVNRNDRKFQIVRILAMEGFREDGLWEPEWLTIRQIARAAKLSTSNYIRDLLAELREEGLIEARYAPARNGLVRYEYRVVNDIFDRELVHEPFVKYFQEMGW